MSRELDPLIDGVELAARRREVDLLDARPLSDEKPGLVGARRAGLEEDLSSPREDAAGGRHPLPTLERWKGFLTSSGFHPGREIVVYDTSSGAMAGCRAWWMLRASGFRRVRLLDGGLAAGVDAGLPVGGDDAGEEGTGQAGVGDAGDVAVTEWMLPLVDAAAVDRIRLEPSEILIDARSRARYRGEEETYDPVAGHIPGALSLPYAELIRGDGRFRSPDELREAFRRLLRGVPPERSAVYCGSGVTACVLLFAMEVAGLGGGALYVGSWSEWCRSGRPRVTVL